MHRRIRELCSVGAKCGMGKRMMGPWHEEIFLQESTRHQTLANSVSHMYRGISNTTVTLTGDGWTERKGKHNINLMTAVNEALGDALLDKRTIIFGEDVGFGGVFRCTQGLQSRFGPDRVFNTPISELGIAGFATGAAAAGLRPVAEIQFADYVFPAFDQIVNEIAKYRYRSGGDFNCGGVTLRMPYGAVGHGGHYHSQSPEAFFTHCPGIKIVVPSGPADTYNLLRAAVECPDPVIFFEPKMLYRTAVEDVDLGAPLQGDELGTAKVVKEGADLTLVAWGRQVGVALEAVEDLKKRHGISVELIDLRTLAPWDAPTVEASVNKTGRLMVTHEAPVTSGFGAEIVARITNRCFLRLEVPPERVCGFDTHFPCMYEPLYLPSKARLVDTAVRMMEY